MGVMTAVTCMPNVVVPQVLNNFVRLGALRVRSHEHARFSAQRRDGDEHRKHQYEPAAPEERTQVDHGFEIAHSVDRCINC